MKVSPHAALRRALPLAGRAPDSAPALTIAVLWLAPLAPAAYAQAPSTVVWTDPVTAPGLDLLEARESLAHPAGGTVSLFLAESGGLDTVVARRVDERGDRLWTATVDISGPSAPWAWGPVRMTSRGSTVFVLHPIATAPAPPRIVSIASDGSLEWDRLLLSPVANAELGVATLGSTDDGDVVLGGIIDSFVLPPFAGFTTARRLDGATGNEDWRYETPGINTTFGAFANERTYLLHVDGVADYRLTCLDAAGAVVYSHVLPALNGLPPISFMEAHASGRVAIGFRATQGATTSSALLLDAAGAVTATIPSTVLASVQDVTYTEAGDIVAMTTPFASQLVRRFDPAGTVVWQIAIPNFGTEYRALHAAPEDGVTIAAIDGTGTFPFVDAKLVFVTAAGTTLGAETFTQSTATYGDFGALTYDARGNLYIGLLRYEGGPEPTLGEVVKVVPGGLQGTVSCTATAPNSTGSTGRLHAAGRSSVDANNLTLVAHDLPPAQFVLFLNSRTQGFTPHPGGSQGDLCLGGSIGRYVGPGEIRRTDPAGSASLQLELPTTPQGVGSVSVLAGETWFFQAWHRDVVGGLASSNLTDALEVSFL